MNRELVVRNFTRAYSGMYRGRLWINRLAREAVLRPQLGSLFVHAARIRPAIIEAAHRENCFSDKSSFRA